MSEVQIQTSCSHVAEWRVDKLILCEPYDDPRRPTHPYASNSPAGLQTPLARTERRGRGRARIPAKIGEEQMWWDKPAEPATASSCAFPQRRPNHQTSPCGLSRT